MDYEITEKEVKEFVLRQLDNATYAVLPMEVRNNRAIAFGAVQFAANHLFPSYNYDLANWWDEVIYNKFVRLEEEKANV